MISPSLGLASDRMLPGAAAIFLVYSLAATSQVTSSTGADPDAAADPDAVADPAAAAAAEPDAVSVAVPDPAAAPEPGDFLQLASAATVTAMTTTADFIIRRSYFVPPSARERRGLGGLLGVAGAELLVVISRTRGEVADPALEAA